METEEIKITHEIKSNVEVGSLVARRVDSGHKYRVAYITTDSKAILVSQYRVDTSAILDLLYPEEWKKVIESID
jgi:hypothetical protein